LGWGVWGFLIGMEEGRDEGKRDGSREELDISYEG